MKDTLIPFKDFPYQFDGRKIWYFPVSFTADFEVWYDVQTKEMKIYFETNDQHKSIRIDVFEYENRLADCLFHLGLILKSVLCLISKFKLTCCRIKCHPFLVRLINRMWFKKLCYKCGIKYKLRNGVLFLRKSEDYEFIDGLCK